MANAREIVLDMLIDINEKGEPSHIVISEYLNRHGELSEQDRAFVKRLCQGTVERRLNIDYKIDKLSSVRVGKLKPAIRNLLRMGIYQMDCMSVPDSAACNEAVAIAKRRGFGQLSGFVNGVLRNYARQRDVLNDFSTVPDEVRRLSLIYSCPEWIVRMWLDRFGRETTEKTLSVFLTDNMTSVRCNSSKADPDAVASTLAARGITVRRGRYSRRAIKLGDYGALGAIEEFRNGTLTVQDESSVIAGEAAGFRPNDRVLDICAAPGGKSLNAADIMLSAGGKGRVLACDISEAKVRLIRENIDRCGFSNIRTRVSDATVYEPEFDSAFDVVLADVPCSGLGIMGKKPDIRYNMTPEKISGLVELQRSILDNAVRYVKPGGRLVFSTCTIDAAENEDNVRYLCEKHGLQLVTDAQEPLNGGMVQLMPGVHGTDGFFVAVLTRQ